MANETLRQGNSYIETPEVTLTKADDTPFELAGSTVRLTATNPDGTTALTHTLVVNAFGTVTTSNGLSMVGPSTNGVVTNTLTKPETAAMSGWIHWVMTVTGTDGNTNDVASGGWNILPSIQYVVPNGVTVRSIRRRILQRLGDLIVATASEDCTDGTFCDKVRLVGEPNAYRGMQALFVSPGPNYGEERYVTGSSRDDRAISFDYSLPTAVNMGDEVELINFRGMGYKFDDVTRALEAAIEGASDTASEPVMMVNTSAFTDASGVIHIPDDWIAVGGVQWRDADDLPWNNLTYSSRHLGSGWSVDRANRTITIGGERSKRINDKMTQIYGFRRPQMPTNDLDLVGINAEWLVAECVSRLSQAAFRRTPTQERQQVMAMDVQDAGILRSRVLRRTGPNVVRL
jgi:hypothetical protein